LKVLASYPDGKATLAAMKADLAILAGAGPAWSERLKRLAARMPDLDIFSQGLVLRDDAGWQLTSAGRELLRSTETSSEASPLGRQAPAPVDEEALSAAPVIIDRPRPRAEKRDRRRGRRRAAKLMRSA
jgi:hypothetical protein